MAALLADRGLDIAAVDLPLYGRTTSPEPGAVRYDDWVRLLVDLVDAERDGRPLILLGASIGGMLAYEVAARSSHVTTVAATCLLDPRDWRARTHMTRFGPLGILGGPLSALARGRVATAMVPMNWVAKLSKMSRVSGLSALCATDPRGGGASVPIGFLASYMQYRHASPESMRTPVVLLHPSLDAWTPVELSMRVFRRLASPGKVVMLRECGHFPIEEPGIHRSRIGRRHSRSPRDRPIPNDRSVRPARRGVPDLRRARPGLRTRPVHHRRQSPKSTGLGPRGHGARD